MASSPAAFMSYLVRNCTAKQVEVLRAKMEEGWKPFKVAGTTARPLIFCSRTNGVRSNIVPGADHLRIEPQGQCIRYDPKRR